jgi:hypothetical protein
MPRRHLESCRRIIKALEKVKAPWEARASKAGPLLGTPILIHCDGSGRPQEASYHRNRCR